MSKLNVKLRIDFGDDNAIGPGKIALLECMRDTGSLSQAARQLDMSYRRAWQLLESLNGTFREPVIVTSVGGKGGGGSVITEFGQSLIDAYRKLERAASTQADEHFASIASKVKRKSPATSSAPRRRLSKATRSPAARGTRARGSKQP